MKQRFFLAVLGVGAFTVSAPLIGCGDFSADEDEAGTGGVAGDGDASTGGDDGTGTGGMSGDGDGTGGMTAEPPLEVSCENVVPCGGVPTGNWFATESCLSIDGVLNTTALGIGCTEGTVTGSLEVTGNFKVDPENADGQKLVTDSTSASTGIDAPLQIYLGPDCLDVSGTTIQCDGVSIPLQGAGFTDQTVCVPAAEEVGGCDCTAPVDQDTVPGFVTKQTSDVALYTAEGNVFSLQGNVVVDYDYCVQGDTMLVTPKTVGDVGTATGTILFVRQN